MVCRERVNLCKLSQVAMPITTEVQNGGSSTQFMAPGIQLLTWQPFSFRECLRQFACARQDKWDTFTIVHQGNVKPPPRRHNIV